MALQNLTPEQLSGLHSGQAEKVVDELHADLQTAEDGTRKMDSRYCQYWGLIRFALTAAKVFTPDRIDAKIDELIKAGDQACNPAGADTAPASTPAADAAPPATGSAAPPPADAQPAPASSDPATPPPPAESEAVG